MPAFRIKRLLPVSSAVLARMRTAARVAMRPAIDTRDRVRVWVPGCKTGGVAYGVAMLLQECAGEPLRPGCIQVFGTDDDEEALVFARKGRYPAGAALGLEPELRGRYTFDEGDTLRMAESLRESCIFAPHRLGQTAPLSRMDLVVCHRLFEGVPAARRRDIVHALYSALREDGVLLAIDHRHYFPEDLFELSAEGYFHPRATRRRALRSHLRLTAHAASRSARRGERPGLGPAVVWERELEGWLATIRHAAEVLGHLSNQTPRLADVQRRLHRQISHATRLVDESSDVRQRAARRGDRGGNEALAAAAIAGAGPAAEQEPAAESDLGFLAGGGILGELTRTFDWASTPLGAATRWAPGLQTAVSIMLGCPTPVLIWWGPALIQLYNDASLPLLGARHPRALGRAAPEGWADAWPVLGTGAAMVMREGRSYRERQRAIAMTRDGPACVVDIVASPIRSSAGRVEGVFCALNPSAASGTVGDEPTVRSGASRSASEFAAPRVQGGRGSCGGRGSSVESALRESEERFRALVHASSYAIYRMSPDWSEVRWLDGRGFVRDVLQPSRAWLAEYIDTSDQAEVMAAVERAVANRTPFELEHRVRRADGTLGWTLSRAVPLFDTQGEIVEWMGAASDITARKQGEQALRASEARLLHADKAKDEFLAMLGHELRTPLAAILLWGSALRSGRLPPAEIDRAVAAIVESAEAQSRVIDDLLDLSRLTAGKLRLEPSPVNVVDAVRAAVTVVMPSAAAKGVRIELEFGEPLGLALLDAARLRQVLWNLLSNAIEFSAEGGRVRLLVRELDSALDVEVSDDGEGIHPDFLPRLFDRFSQGGGREKRKQGGLGIGLALCRQLVELQGGTIGAHSAGLGQGATFHFRLPWIAVEPGSEARSPQPRPISETATSLQGVSVLLVDDERNTLAAMQMTLERSGARVFAASSAASALSLLDAVDRPGAVPVLVSELGLPGISGFLLVEQLAAARRAFGRPPLPACAVSAHARAEDRRRALDAGFDMFLPKPVAPDRLIEAVDDLSHVARGEVTPLSPER